MSVKLTKDTMTPSLKRMQKELNKVPKKTYDYFVSITPRRSGQARRKTRFKGNKTIIADYAYAKRLNEGWSKQAPEGMTKPTEKFFKDLVKNIMKRK